VHTNSRSRVQAQASQRACVRVSLVLYASLNSDDAVAVHEVCAHAFVCVGDGARVCVCVRCRRQHCAFDSDRSSLALVFWCVQAQNLSLLRSLSALALGR
jgi:hypothetical protein